MLVAGLSSLLETLAQSPAVKSLNLSCSPLLSSVLPQLSSLLTVRVLSAAVAPIHCRKPA